MGQKERQTRADRQTFKTDKDTSDRSTHGQTGRVGYTLSMGQKERQTRADRHTFETDKDTSDGGTREQSGRGGVMTID